MALYDKAAGAIGQDFEALGLVGDVQVSDTPTATTHHVLMRIKPGIPTPGPTDGQLLNEARLAELREVAIHGGQADVRQLSANALKHLTGVRMPGHATQGAKDLEPLRRESELRFAVRDGLLLHTESPP